MRLFAAIDVPESVRSELGELSACFRRHGADIKWTQPHQFHLTIKFLEEVPDGALEGLQRALSEAASGIKPFLVRLAAIGGFPDLRKPKILWVGADQGRDRMEELFKNIEEALEKEGFERESRPFHAHLTLGRVRGTGGLDPLIGEIKWRNFVSAHRFETDRLMLYRSTLGPGEAVHEVIAHFPLEGK